MKIENIVCRDCGRTSEEVDFYMHKKRGVPRQPCKECTKAAEKIKRDRYKNSEKNIPKSKVCSSCGIEKEAKDFHKRIDTPTGLRDRCKDCFNAGSREYYAENSEKVIARTTAYVKKHQEYYNYLKRMRYKRDPVKYKGVDRAYREANRDRINSHLRERNKLPEVKERLAKARRRHYLKHKDRILDDRRKWRQQNKDIVCFYAAKRRAKVKSATPPWANMGKIKILYKEASRLGLSVDHTIPLSNPVVCGLHCEFNLQLMPLSENIAKNNKFEIQEHVFPEDFVNSC